MPSRIMSPEQHRGWKEDGYFIVRHAITTDEAIEIRGVLRNTLLTPNVAYKSDEIDPNGNRDATYSQVRKLNKICLSSPLIWKNVHANKRILAYAQEMLGDDIVLKFSSCFLKPSRTGSETPWHQDNGLWRDEELTPFNFWMAIDPSTIANGCLKIIPRSHFQPIHPHVLYENSIHAEIPREVVQAVAKENGVVDIELQPGDMVCWHSSLFHSSPKNFSDHSRIGIAGVYSTPTTAAKNPRFKDYSLCLRDGTINDTFPPIGISYPGDPTRDAPPPDFIHYSAATVGTPATSGGY